MSIAEPPNSRPQLSRAVFILHSVLPLVVGVYYFLAAVVSYLRQPRGNYGKAKKKVLRNVIFWLVFGVAISYVSYGSSTYVVVALITQR